MASRFSSRGKRKSCALNPKELATLRSVGAFGDFIEGTFIFWPSLKLHQDERLEII